MTEQFANLAKSTLNGAINTSVTTITVANGAIFPSSGNYRILVDNELMLVTARSGNNLTVTRGIESTTAASHLAGVNVALVFTAALMQTLWNSLSTFQGDVNAAGHSLSGLLNLIANNVQTTTLQNFASGTISMLSDLDMNGKSIGDNSQGDISVTNNIEMANYNIDLNSLSSANGSISVNTQLTMGGQFYLNGQTFDGGNGNIQNVNVAQTNEMHMDTLQSFSGGAITINSAVNMNATLSMGDNQIIGISSLTLDNGLIAGAGTISDNTGNAAIDISNHLLFSIGATQNLLDFSGTYDSFASMCFDGSTIAFNSNTSYHASLINDATNIPSIDPNNRLFFGSDGSTVAIDTTMSGFNSSAAMSFGISGVLDTYIGGVIRSGNDTNTSVNANGRTLGDSSNNTSLDWDNRILEDTSNVGSLNWNTRVLFDIFGNDSVDWQSRLLVDGSGVRGVDYSNRELFDASGVASMLWGSRTLNDTSGATQFSWTTTGVRVNKNIISYNQILTKGQGVPSIYGYARLTAKTAAQASVATYTVGASDGSFTISANVLVTTATLHNFTVTCTYTDEGNTSRTVTLPFSSLAGAIVTAIANAGGTAPYEGVPLHIRAKSGTAITIASTGTFTTVTYNIEGLIIQTAN